jgi:dienelactone hydrolase
MFIGQRETPFVSSSGLLVAPGAVVVDCAGGATSSAAHEPALITSIKITTAAQNLAIRISSLSSSPFQSDSNHRQEVREIRERMWYQRAMMRRSIVVMAGVIGLMCGIACRSHHEPPVASLPSHMTLPDPLIFQDGTRVQSPADWARHRAELRELILHNEYGELPPAPGNVMALLLTSSPTRPTPAKPQHREYKIACGPHDSLSCFIDLTIPPGAGPFPIVIRGDRCWGAVADPIADELKSRGYALADFNRLEFAPDTGKREGELFAAYPHRDFGALAAWAWGFSRVIDFVETLPEIDKTKIIVTGASRGGKAALLAGALDERVAITNPVGSGTGGILPFRNQPAQAEKLTNMLKAFPHWMSRRLTAFSGNEEKLPFDSHEVIALCAPRAFIATEATEDKYSNPRETWKSIEAAREVYNFLGIPQKIAVTYRPGPHEHNLTDWKSLLDFADKIFFNKSTTRPFDQPPVTRP